tara:strand:+ start:375 stop:626 length:252 start_codon:yes stop_codon:yes gene_type:complete
MRILKRVVDKMIEGAFDILNDFSMESDWTSAEYTKLATKVAAKVWDLRQITTIDELAVRVMKQEFCLIGVITLEEVFELIREA